MQEQTGELRYIEWVNIGRRDIEAATGDKNDVNWLPVVKVDSGALMCGKNIVNDEVKIVTDHHMVRMFIR